MITIGGIPADLLHDDLVTVVSEFGDQLAGGYIQRGCWKQQDPLLEHLEQNLAAKRGSRDSGVRRSSSGLR